MTPLHFLSPRPPLTERSCCGLVYQTRSKKRARMERTVFVECGAASGTSGETPEGEVKVVISLDLKCLQSVGLQVGRGRKMPEGEVKVVITLDLKTVIDAFAF
ncbi:hypothetical protein F2P81_001183 [Scophthalmus maximus]|uniref:Uncharacterized protein n=1 Tax=Scophthalmus maximus TaxID=52904 RepID=A0A6A4TV59_SCOMX|nr:hypothetical protein F2P81_001183 [Scophthalmus maximus]